VRGAPVVVAGAAGGIGSGIARHLASAAPASSLALLDSDAGRLDGVAADIGEGAFPLSCDLTAVSEVTRATEQIRSRLGVPRALVWAVGWSRRGAFADTSHEQHVATVDINFIALLNLTLALLPDLLAGHEEPRIVVVGSDGARVGVRNDAVYAAAKAAAGGFARSLAAEVADHGLTVNVVSAGSTDAPMLNRFYSELEIEKRVRANPMGRLGTPADIAGAVAFFLSAEAAYITGQTLSVNGGALRVA
jgi:2-hydroxycyclohexanecarboxyl-CoA dehydrogenase